LRRTIVGQIETTDSCGISQEKGKQGTKKYGGDVQEEEGGRIGKREEC